MFQARESTKRRAETAPIEGSLRRVLTFVAHIRDNNSYFLFRLTTNATVNRSATRQIQARKVQYQSSDLSFFLFLYLAGAPHHHYHERGSGLWI